MTGYICIIFDKTDRDGLRFDVTQTRVGCDPCIQNGQIGLDSAVARDDILFGLVFVKVAGRRRSDLSMASEVIFTDMISGKMSALRPDKGVDCSSVNETTKVSAKLYVQWFA